MDRGWKPKVEISPTCPRCGSSNTKFCYYNNYSLTQPRYFCKGCRRYWTKGGSLRNVPVGGGCRKNRRGNKSFRPSTSNGVAHSRSFDDLIINKHPYDHGFPERVSQDDSSSPSHIDIACVYANFLNPQPDSKDSGLEISELHSEFDRSLGLTANVSSINSEAIVGLPEDEQGLFACLNEADLGNYFPGLESTSTDQQQDITQNFTPLENPIVDIGNNNGLPLLPGEDHLVEASQVILWYGNSYSLIKDEHTFEVPQQSVLGSNILDPNHLFFGNWSPFQFSR